MRSGQAFVWLTRRVHISWLIAWLCASIVAGLALSAFVEVGWDFVPLLLIGVTLILLGLTHTSRWALGVLLIAGLSLGLARGDSYGQQLLGYDAYYGTSVVASGMVAEDVTVGAGGELRMRLRAVVIDDVRLPGELWASTETVLDIKRGDQVRLRGLLSEGFGNLPASMHRATMIGAERPINGDVAREFRDWFADKIRLAIPEPKASLGIGFLVGQRSSLPETLDASLLLLGLTHVVVASGYNLTILVRFTRRLFARYSKYLALLSGILLIVGFILVTGLSPSMSRAGLVAIVSLLAWYFGRSVHPLVLLSLAAATTALINPAFVWGDLGWYLSFTAFAGIMILAPLLTHYFWGADAQLTAPLRILVETLSAQIATLPLIIFVFGQYSWLALPANMLILPFVPLAMLLTFIAGIGASTIPVLATIIGLPASAVLTYMTAVVDWMARLPWASGELSVGPGTMALLYGLLIGVCIFLWRKTRHSFRQDNLVV